MSIVSVSSAIIRPGRNDLQICDTGLFFDLIDDIFGLTDLSVNQTCLHTGNRFPRQNGIWLFNFNLRQARRILPQRLCRNSNAGCGDADTEFRPL